MMKKFIALTQDERQKMFVEKENTTFVIERSVLGFENIENEISSIELGKSFQLSPGFIDENIYTRIILFSPNTNEGRWIRTMYRVYLEKGHVEYKKMNENDFEVKIIF